MITTITILASLILIIVGLFTSMIIYFIGVEEEILQLFDKGKHKINKSVLVWFSVFLILLWSSILLAVFNLIF